MGEKLQKAIKLIKSGQKRAGYQLLIEITRSDPSGRDAEIAWLWISSLVKEPQQKRICLNNVLSINPNNKLAIQALNDLDGNDNLEIQDLPPLGEIVTSGQHPTKIPTASKKRKGKSCIFILLLLFAGFLLFLCFSTFIAFYGSSNGSVSNRTRIPPTATELPSVAKARWGTVDIREFTKNPDRYIGDEVHYSGEVFSIEEDRSKTAMQIWVQIPGGNEFNREAVVIFWNGSSPGIYEGTIVEVWGYGAGSLDGKNAFGATISNPLIEAEYLSFQNN